MNELEQWKQAYEQAIDRLNKLVHIANNLCGELQAFIALYDESDPAGNEAVQQYQDFLKRHVRVKPQD